MCVLWLDMKLWFSGDCMYMYESQMWTHGLADVFAYCDLIPIRT